MVFTITGILVLLSRTGRHMPLSVDDIGSLLNAYGFMVSLLPSQYGCKKSSKQSSRRAESLLDVNHPFQNLFGNKVMGEPYTVYPQSPWQTSL